MVPFRTTERNGKSLRSCLQVLIISILGVAVGDGLVAVASYTVIGHM